VKRRYVRRRLSAGENFRSVISQIARRRSRLSPKGQARTCRTEGTKKVVLPPYDACRTIPSMALIATAAIPTGMAIFHPMLMSWS